MNDWKQILAESFGGHDETLSPLLVEIEAGQERVLARVNGDGLSFPGPSDGAAPDLTIRFGEHSAEDVLLKRADPVAAFGDAEVSAGGEWRPAMPAAEAELVAADRFEPVSGATLRGVILVTGTMFGDICLVEGWEDGRPVGLQTAAPARFEELEVELRFTCSLAQLTALRRGEITPPDAFADGAELKTDWPYMSAWVELMQHPAFGEAYAEAPAVEAQIAWGQTLSSPAYAEAAIRARGGQPSPA